MAKELAKTYNPREVEDKIYKYWIDGKYFHAEVDKNKKPYTVMMPPPNITGQLHMGHALDVTLQDILIRFRRMQGYNALWMPGTDHASIATESKIVAAMKEEGLTKDMIGREKFLERAWDWKEKYGGTINSQQRKLGASCDWDRERFTMDEGCSKAVKEVFVNLYNKGLIYRGERMINWCPHCLTSISDAEIEYKEMDTSFWHIRYPYSDGSGYIYLATTRPETLLGDTAVAVNPEDDRYKDVIGKTVVLPLVNREIPVIADDYVEKDFGTGVVKITPAHDPNDYEVGKRHNLPIINLFTDDLHMNKNAGKYEGMTSSEARKAIVEDLKACGALVKIEPMKHNVGTCERCHSIIEPKISKQWFVKMEELAKPAVEAVEDGKIKFIPERYNKTYFHWMRNVRDWCISRQLWWGHRIPAWYCEECGEITVSKDVPEKCCKCGSTHLHQDPDTLDTWFSSALWPFSTLGWPEKTEELKQFYPTSTLVTGYDIIFHWVARMIFSGIEHTGDIPFDTVLFHGIVRDANGVKMSKSLGNGVDPLKVIDEYGADALRFSLANGNSPGNDMRYIPEKVESSRNFANKLWNATRFIMMNLEGHDVTGQLPNELSLSEKWIVSSLNTLIKDVTDNLEKFELGVAVAKLYDFVWDVFCDWYIELAKIEMQGETAQADSSRNVLLWCIKNILKLLHPFMPFITEEIWQTLPTTEGTALIVSEWPIYEQNLEFKSEEKELSRMIDAIRAIRNRRNEMNVPPSKKANIHIETTYEDTFKQCSKFIARLAYANEVEINTGKAVEGAVNIVTSDAKIFIPMAELVDFAAEKERLNKELAATMKKYELTCSKLSNERFISKAPAAVVEKEKAAKVEMEEKISMIKASLANL